jgi:hypothetical protein
MDDELREYLAGRRQQVLEARGAAVHQNGEWAADGALHELDRMESWLNLRRERQLIDARITEAAHGAFVAEAER